jgi:ADP-dependent NAD(P)H-hydrate dehydratase / NAD(P)H-hydrate epimerase
MKLADARTIQAIDRRSIRDYGVKGLQLMENAGRGVAEIILRELPKGGCVSIIAGKGNNGGDGFVAARHLKNRGVDVAVFSFAPIEEIKGDAGVNAASWKNMDGEVFFISTGSALKNIEPKLRHSSIIVDGIFGTGLSSPVRGFYAELIELVNGLDKKIIAIDIPSGIDATTGAILGTAVRADITATMAMPKIGLYTYPGRDYSGRIEIVDIGAPRVLIEDKAIKWDLTTGSDVKGILKPRSGDSHKGTYGHVLVLAGSPGKTGAALMSAMGAMRMGAGLSTIGVPEGLLASMEAKTVEVMTVGLPQTPHTTLGLSSYDAIKRFMADKSALVIGPGLGVSDDIAGLIRKIIKEADYPIVIDADGLNNMAGRVDALRDTRASIILTPHPGEMARLMDMTTSQVQSDRLGVAEALARKTRATVVLKGAGTVIAEANGAIHINPTGNPGLSTAGTGDVLSGMIGGLLAQGYDARPAAIAAVYIHGAAGDEVKKENGGMGMIATDILPFIPKVIRSLTES